MNIARLPFEVREAPGKIDGMLAAAAGDLEDKALRRQPILQHLGDRLAVAERGGRGPPGAHRGRFVEPPLVAHSAACAGSGSRYVSTGFRAASFSSSRRRGA